MTVATWLRTLSTRTPRKPARAGRRPAFRPRLQSLEDRCVPSFGWAAAAGGNAVATDAAGNAYVTGSTTAKYSRSGALIWADSFGGSSIAVDGAGNVSVAGLYTGTVTIGSTMLTSPGGTDAFAAKLDGATGAVTWARNGLSVPGKRVIDSSMSVAADAAGNVYVGDLLEVAADYHPWNVAIFKLDGDDGATQWTDQFLGVRGHGTGAVLGDSEAPRLTVAGVNVYVTGSFALSVDFDPGPGTYTLKSNSVASGFVVKLTSGGAFGWAVAFQGVSSGGGNPAGQMYPGSGITVDGLGNVYTTGTFNYAIDFDPAPDGKQGQGKLILNGGTGSGFVTKLNASGNLVWAKQFGAGSRSNGLAVDAAGAVYLTGSFTGTVDFNPGAGVFNMTSAGGSDIFVAKLDTAGAFQWAIRAGASADDSGTGIAVNSSGEIYVTGRIGGGTVDFDLLTLPYGDDRDLLTGPGGFLWQIVQP